MYNLQFSCFLHTHCYCLIIRFKRVFYGLPLFLEQSLVKVGQLIHPENKYHHICLRKYCEDIDNYCVLEERFKTFLIKRIKLQLLGKEGEGEETLHFLITTSRDFPLFGLNLPAYSLRLV